MRPSALTCHDAASAGSNDQVNVDPKLGPLASNGGLTPTHALGAGSGAIDKVLIALFALWAIGWPVSIVVAYRLHAG